MNGAEPFLGNSQVIERLEAKLASGRLPHALIFSGPEGVGKRTYALKLIQALNCIGDSLYGCGECRSCQKIERGSHPDVTTISIDDDRSQIRIEQVRSLRESLLLEPAEGAVRATIIDPADRLTPGAANALLKALEEPPPRTFFFLITPNANELLVTIRSRCQVYQFAPLSLDSIRRLGITDELIARWSQGSMGRIRGTDAEELRQNRDRMLEFLDVGMTGNPARLADLIGTKLAPSRDEHAELIRAGYFLISDMMRLKLGIEDGIINIDIQDRLAAVSSAVSTDHLLDAARQLRFIEANLRHYLNPQLMTDAALASLSNLAK